MFRSFKLKNIRVTVFSLVCLALFVAVCLLALRAGAPDTVTINGEDYSLRAENDGDIAAFINVCGYETRALVSVTEITVPKHWNDTYIQYNDLQKEQGFNLLPCKGKPAQERVYSVYGGEDYITLLVGNNTIIAAHISAMDGGEMKPLINEQGMKSALDR